MEIIQVKGGLKTKSQLRKKSRKKVILGDYIKIGRKHLNKCSIDIIEHKRANRQALEIFPEQRKGYFSSRIEYKISSYYDSSWDKVNILMDTVAVGDDLQKSINKIRKHTYGEEE